MPPDATRPSSDDAGRAAPLDADPSPVTQALFRSQLEFLSARSSIEDVRAALHGLARLAEGFSTTDRALLEEGAVGVLEDSGIANARTLVHGALYPDQAPSPAPDEWEPVIPLGLGDLPTFPTRALPDWLGDFVEREAEATQTPPDLAALLGLGAVAATVQGKLEVVVRRDYREPLNLFVAVALPPGTRKSPVFTAATRPLVEWEREQWESQKVTFAQAQHQRRLLEKRLERAEAEAARVTDPVERTAAEDEARALVAQLAETPEPVRPRLWTDDVTSEALARLLAEQGGRISVFAPEGGGLFAIMAGRYSTGSNFEIYLKAHAGDPLRVDRRHAEPIYVPRPTLTLAVTMQPAVLHGLHETPEFRGRGLLARFLYGFPLSPLGDRDADPAPLPEHVERDYAAGLRELLALQPSAAEAGRTVPHTVHLSPEGRERWLAFVRALEPRLGEAGDLHTVADWAAKLPGAVIRLAGLLHCARERSQPWARPIAAATMRDAVAISDYLLPHARAAFRTMGTDPAVAEAEYLLGHIRRRAVATLTKRDLFQWTRGHFDQVAELEPALAVLVAHNYLRPMPPPKRDGPGRPASPGFAVNPAVHTQNPQNSAQRVDSEDSEDALRCFRGKWRPAEGSPDAGSGPRVTVEPVPELPCQLADLWREAPLVEPVGDDDLDLESPPAELAHLPERLCARCGGPLTHHGSRPDAGWICHRCYSDAAQLLVAAPDDGQRQSYVAEENEALQDVSDAELLR